ncbi:MAG TPA: VWA domain-containing protein [Phycisphaerae bacterium]|nr:VWA domain-containing protein [Phycisphaerae bacterium]
MSFEPGSVYFLIALALLPLIWWRWLQRRPSGALLFSSVATLQRQGRGLGVRLRHAIPVLRTLAVGLLIVCLANPRKGNEKTRIYAEGIAIQMVVDISGSMENRDFLIDRERHTRLDAVKRIFRGFVEGDAEDLAGRPDDLIGLIGFACYPDSLAPLTLDHENVLAILDESETAEGPTAQKRFRTLERAMLQANAAGDRRRVGQIEAEMRRLQEENKTAIGDAIALAVERLRDLDRRLEEERDRRLRATGREVKSKVIILLTDGHNNAGDLSPLQGAQLAQAMGIKMYTIGIGSQRGGQDQVDAEQMRRAAESTGGKYYWATDTQSLHAVYAEIDKLERTETEERRYLQYRQLATSSTVLGGVRVPPLLMIVLGLLVLEIILANTRLRRIP